jgi:hypothetical protein
MRRGWIAWSALGLSAGAFLLAAPAAAEPGAVTASDKSGTAATVHCTINDPRITESSGLAVAGTGADQRLYTLNDGGTKLQVYELTAACRVTKSITASIDPYDVEDLARSADGTLWLADFGDNDHTRRTIAIELLTETGQARLYRFAYPDGPHDAEALLLDRAGQPYVVTKEPLGASGVYTPAGKPSTAATTPLRKVTTLRFGPTGTRGGPVGLVGQLLVTGGAVSPDGTRIALRTYTDAYVWRADNGDVAAALTNGKPTRIPLPPTAQGEAVTFTPDGRSLLTSTEGRPAAVHQIPLGPLAAASPSPGPATPAGASAHATSPNPRTAARAHQFGKLAVAFVIAAVLVWGGTRISTATRRGG